MSYTKQEQRVADWMKSRLGINKTVLLTDPVGFLLSTFDKIIFEDGLKKVGNKCQKKKHGLKSIRTKLKP